MKKGKIRKINSFYEKRKKTVLSWNRLDTKMEDSVPYGREILFLPDTASKASPVIFSKENGNTRLCMDHSLCLQYEGSGMWAEMPGKKDMSDGY